MGWLPRTTQRRSSRAALSGPACHGRVDHLAVADVDPHVPRCRHRPVRRRKPGRRAPTLPQSAVGARRTMVFRRAREAYTHLRVNPFTRPERSNPTPGVSPRQTYGTPAGSPSGPPPSPPSRSSLCCQARRTCPRPGRRRAGSPARPGAGHDRVGLGGPLGVCVRVGALLHRLGGAGEGHGLPPGTSRSTDPPSCPSSEGGGGGGGPGAGSRCCRLDRRDEPAPPSKRQLDHHRSGIGRHGRSTTTGPTLVGTVTSG